jgi:predicted kinase
VVRVALFVAVGGWPGSGKSTLAAGLAGQLRLALLAKDEIKEALMDGLGRPGTVTESRRLGRAATLAMLRAAAGCPGAVLDGTWFEYARPWVVRLPGRVVEVACRLPVAEARRRYRARAASRHAGHLDAERSEDELWGRPFQPLGVGPLIEVDTSVPVDVAALARAVAAA